MTERYCTVNISVRTKKQARLIRVQWAVIALLAVALIVSLTHWASAASPAPSEPAPQAVVMIPELTPEPEPELEPSETPSSEPAPERVSLGEFTLTAYCPCVKCCGVWSAEHPSRAGTDYVQKTRSGTVPEEGRTVGVDPAVIPLGSSIYIDGHAYVAEDTGSVGGGSHIDIFYQSHEAARAFGVQTATVYILNNEGDEHHA